MLGVLVLGLATGGLYALGSLGIVCIYRGSRVLNLALGGVATWGGYLFVEFRNTAGIPGLLAALLVVAAGALFGAVAYLTVIRPIRGRTELVKLAMSLGMFAALSGAAQLAFGTNPEFVTSSLPTNSIVVAGAHVGEDRLLILAMTLVIALAVGGWSGRGRIALAMRAVAENERGVASLGYSPHVLGALSWALGCALAALAGTLLAPIVGLTPAGLSVIVVPSLAAALLGRFDSYGWAVAGGLGLGAIEGIATRYLSFAGWSEAAPLLVIIVALLVRRDREANRSRPSQGIPIARELPVLNVVIFALFAGFVLFGTTNWVTAATASMCFALIGLSVVVIVGYANQISVAQMAIAGVAALVAAHLMLTLHLPFVIVPVIGAIVGGLVGLVVGIPALRLSGVNLAVVTIGMSVATEALVFNNPSLDGGFAGINLPTPSLFGQSIQGFTHPVRYALFVMAWLSLAAALVVGLRRSRFGRQLLALRTNQQAAAALGVGVARTKIAAFGISSMLAGMAGVLLVFQNTNLNLTSGFAYTDSINLIVVVLLFGVTSVRGGLLSGVAAIGGIVYTAVSHSAFVSDNYSLVSGLLLIYTVLRHPAGATYIRERVRGLTLPKDSAAGRLGLPLTVRDVSVSFGGVHAVVDISLQATPGSVVGIVGPNGAGKSTLLDAISGFAPTVGSIQVGDVQLSGTSPRKRARAGVARVFQGVELFEDLTVVQNLCVPIDAGGWHRALPSAARELILRAELESDFAALPSSLSLGRRKLIGVARALVSNPAVILLDEPAAGLSSAEAGELGIMMRGLADRHGLAVVLVDHDMPLVMATCDVVYVLVDGSVLAHGTPAEIMGSRIVRDAYLGETLGDAGATVSTQVAADVLASYAPSVPDSAETP